MKKNGNNTGIYVFNMVIQFFLETFIAMVIGYFLGKWLDKLLFDEKVILTYFMVVIGIFSGLSNLIKRSLKFGKEEENEK